MPFAQAEGMTSSRMASIAVIDVFVLRKPNVSLALSKEILNRTFELSEEQALALGREAQAICYTTSEHHDSVAAFLKKKKP